MAYFSNRTINCLNRHTALMGLLEQAYVIFGPLYLHSRGFTVAGIFGVIAVSIIARVPMRLLCLPLIHRFGLKPAVIIGMIGYALTFPILSHVKGVDGWLLLYIFIYSIFNSMHWFAYHAWYSIAGEQAHRGRQVAMAYALTAMIAALAPYISAVTITHAGFKDYFLFVIPLTFLMLLNLRGCENTPVAPIDWKESGKAARSLGVKIHLFESCSTYPNVLCWLFAVYSVVHNTLAPLGGIITFGIMAQIVYQLVVGAWVDKGRGLAVVNVAGFLRLGAALGRAFLPLSLPVIFGLQAASAAGDVHHLATQPTANYNHAKQSTNPLLYWLFTEIGWDVGTFIGAGLAYVLLWQGMELRHVILIALPPMAALWWLLHGYYSKHAYVVTLS